jgi:hypothetical protein
MKALVIYNENPDRCRFFCLQDPSVDEVVMLEHLQGVAINNDELNEMQETSAEMLSRKINGTDDRIPEWSAAADTDAVTFKEDFKRNVEGYIPERVFFIVFFL